MVQDNDAADAGVKPWYASKTIWGAGVGALGMVSGLVGFQIDPATQKVLLEQSYAAFSAVSALIGTVLVVYGRLKAVTTLTATKV